jgi:tetratricopeptide (TPR) repeat protein
MKNLLSLVLLLTSLSAYCEFQDSSQVFYQKGLEEKAARRYLVASKNFDRAIELNPNFTDAYLENGYVNLEMRKTDIAKTNFVKVNQLDPSNTAAIKELVNLFYSYHQFQDAINYAQKCKSCEGFDKMIGMCYFKMEDYGNAEKKLLSVIAKDPKDAEATYTLAKTYLEMQLDTKAIPYYEKAISLDDSKYNWSLELALIYFNESNHKNAVIYFNKAAEKGYPVNNDFNENLGFSYLYSGEFDKGEKVLQTVIARKPGNTEILRDMAEAFYFGKQYDRSLDYCQKLLEMNDKDGKALYQAGLCFQRKGQKDKGQAMCDKAIELDPSLNKLRKKQDLMNAGL